MSKSDLHALTAIHIEGLAGNIICVIAQQERHRCRNVFLSLSTPHRDYITTIAYMEAFFKQNFDSFFRMF